MKPTLHQFSKEEVSEIMAGVARANGELARVSGLLAGKLPQAGLSQINKAYEAVQGLQGTLPVVFHKRTTLGVSLSQEFSVLLEMQAEAAKKVAMPAE